MKLQAILLLLAFSAPGFVGAHGGGLNSAGCHNNRKTGDYHCHRSGGETRKSQGSRDVGDAPWLGLMTPGKPSARPLLAPGTSFGSCAQARAAGATPIRAGEPGYGFHLDRDRDGIACE